MNHIVWRPVWAECLARLRDARALILRDAESFHHAALSLEYVGQILCGGVRSGLGRYENELVGLAASTGVCDPDATRRLFHVVREARNMAVHDGAWARHVNTRLVDFILMLEGAIISKMRIAEDIMVRGPIVAESWHMVAHIRRAMLANSFSCLPIVWHGKWELVCDNSLVPFLHGAANGDDHKRRLGMHIGAAVEAGDVELISAVCLPPTATIEMLVGQMRNFPLLITQEIDGQQRLLGLITSFDLL